MEMSAFWRLMKDAKVLDSTVTLASIDRLFYEGMKNRFRSKTSNIELLQEEIEMLQSFGRALSLEEMRDYVMTYQLKRSASLRVAWYEKIFLMKLIRVRFFSLALLRGEQQRWSRGKRLTKCFKR